MRTCLALLAALLVVLLGVAPAHADDPPPEDPRRAEAKLHFERGVAHDECRVPPAATAEELHGLLGRHRCRRQRGLRLLGRRVARADSFDRHRLHHQRALGHQADQMQPLVGGQPAREADRQPLGVEAVRAGRGVGERIATTQPVFASSSRRGRSASGEPTIRSALWP